MTNTLEAIWAHLIIGILWKIAPSFRSKTLNNFAAIERDTVWQLAQVFQSVDNTRAKELIFRQMVEEAFHSDGFKMFAYSFSDSPLPKIYFQREPLANPDSCLTEFFAECFVGEESATNQLISIRDRCTNREIKLFLDRVISDEQKHVTMASEILNNLNINPDSLSNQIHRLRQDALKTRAKRVITTLSSWLGVSFYSALYFIMGPFAYLCAAPRIYKQGIK